MVFLSAVALAAAVFLLTLRLNLRSEPKHCGGPGLVRSLNRTCFLAAFTDCDLHADKVLQPARQSILQVSRVKSHRQWSTKQCFRECVYSHTWESGSEAKAGAGRWIEFYNRQRPHSALSGRLPAMVY